MAGTIDLSTPPLQTDVRPRVSQHRSWHSAERATVFVDSMPLVEALAYGQRAGVKRVFVAGEKQTAGTVMREAPPGAHVFVDGQYPTISDGTVSVHYLAQWFGEQLGADDGAAMFEALTAALRRSWGDRRLTVFANPAATGVDLWARTIRGHQWPVMSDEAQAIVRRVTGQGRIELFDPPADAGLVVLHEYDMRLAYLAGVRNLPIGEPVPVDEMSGPYAHGRYLVTFDGPAGRVGIIAVAGDVSMGAKKYLWPASGGPVWTTGVELELARRWGVIVTVLEGFEWPATADPLRLWSERLIDLYSVGGDLAGALRAIMLHTIGALHGAARKINETGAEPPVDDPTVTNIRRRKEGGWTWNRIVAPRNPTNSHPEWSTTIWARARRRLLDNGAGAGMLHVPAGQLVAARTDSYFTTKPIDVGDRNRAGSYRLKSRSQPTTWPATAAELLATKGNLDA